MFGEYFVVLRIMASTLIAFCFFHTIIQAQSDPRLEEDLFIRNMLLRQYMNNRISGLIDNLNIGIAQEDENSNEQLKRSLISSDLPFANNGFWRLRRSPSIDFSLKKRLLRLSDQYTPTPCR
ncbi:hypothetical protein Mgra_00006139 [Meloidogyne graminicola]|uniref:Uncharacterized protein n=1 Tax=Meloidogyne graminicola TaxID=189291 RepID=A0A8S9ZM65_9BILA|nr:hypothetical protein Mgra_00006139 [Meloidogyne graminicola]